MPRISKRWSNPHNILGIKGSNAARQNIIQAGQQVASITWTSLR
jgi:hypothetical protein